MDGEFWLKFTPWSNAGQAVISLKMVTTVLKIESAVDFQHAKQLAAKTLTAGDLVALPTETVYGLAANVFSEKAVAKIYEVKGRPSHNPIIVHVAGMEMARDCVADWPESATILAREFWPGALTIVLPKSKRIPDIVTAGGPTVGIRWPSHPFMQAVIQECRFPIAAPSANLSNQVSPTTAEHVLSSLNGKLPLIVDSGPCAVGIESTVIDLSGAKPRILRPGMIHSAQIKKHLPELADSLDTAKSETLKSPGLLQKHYSPRARLLIAHWRDNDELLAFAKTISRDLSQVHVLAYDKIPTDEHFGRVSLIPHDPEAYARALYSELHQSDVLGAQFIIVEEPPATPEWEGVRDRLTRAAR